MSVMNVALSGLNAASGDLEVTGNNIANANTTGYKQSRTEFADVYGGGASGNQTGNGVQISSISQDFANGPINTTGGELDMALNSDGFFTVKQPDGTTAYTRAGNFSTDKEGYIVTSTGSRVQGYTASDGQIGSAIGDIKVPNEPVAPKATGNVTFQRNLDSSESVITDPFDPADASTYNFTDQTPIYDSLGAEHNLNTYYVKTANNTWDVQVEIDGANVATGNIQYGDDGKFQSATGLDNIAWSPSGGAAAQTLDLNYSESSQYGGQSTQGGVIQDGYKSGVYTGLDVSNDGVVSVRYSNGRLEPVAQVAVADFTNPQGLLSVGNMTWVETGSSGEPQVSRANSEGKIRAGSLEGSNVDLTEQLVNMITAQRAFQANAQSIKAGDTLLQTIINIG